MRKNKRGGFLLLEILISALILAGAIASAMYLFRTGFQYLERIKENNLISSKVPQALTYLIKEADLEKGEDTISLGEKVILNWKSTLLEKIRPQIETMEGIFSTYPSLINIFPFKILQIKTIKGFFPTPYELYLYKVEFSISTEKSQKNYQVFITKYKMLTTPKFFKK